jgi:zinc transporter ZupT
MKNDSFSFICTIKLRFLHSFDFILHFLAGESKFLKVLLSFAVGGLLGDVFLHLLPEAWEGENEHKLSKDSHPSMRSGLWVLSGILIFTIVEKIFSGYTNADDENPQPKCVEIANCLLRKRGGQMPADAHESCNANGSCDIEDVPNGCYLAAKQRKEQAGESKKVAGYLNLLANSIDNFTHGLAVAGSFLVSFRHGVLATFAILCKKNLNIRLLFLKLMVNFSPQCMKSLTKSATLPFSCAPGSVDGTRPKLNYLPPVLDCLGHWLQSGAVVSHRPWKREHRGLCRSRLVVSCT